MLQIDGWINLPIARIFDFTTFVFANFCCDLFESLHECVRDCHTREALLATVTPWNGVATHACNQGKIQLELVHQPVDTRPRLEAKYLSDFRLFGATLERVGQEDLLVVGDSLLCLGLGASTIDARSSLG